MSPFKQTPSQTVGPFFHYSLPWKGAADLVAGAGDLGARLDLIPPGHYLLGSGNGRKTTIEDKIIDVVGSVFDADGQPVADALIEIWQADGNGRYASANDPRHRASEGGFLGFGRSSTSSEGAYRFRTVRPGRVPGPDETLQAPHVAVSVLGRGLLKRLVTRIYFADEESNAEDPILALVPESRRHTLMAREENGSWRFDIHLQGNRETVFFEI
jgi:protocatechuate 3,4-dioxygenase, alpha subunit